MKIIKIGKIPHELINDVGGKAKGLDILHKSNLNIPRSFVFCDINNDEDIKKITEFYLNENFDKVAVRSSANVEDGEDFSFAGQFLSFLNIQNENELTNAIKKCLDSAKNEKVLEYTKQFLNNSDIKMNIIIQDMVDAGKAGVVFTKSPNDPNKYLIEAVEGLGECLVSGEKSSNQYFLDAPLKNVQPGCLNVDEVNNIFEDVCIAKIKFNCELDLEWAIDKNGKLFWLQARPITNLDLPTIDEFNPKKDLSKRVITNCNIGEMMPGAVTPLTYSISLYGIDWGMRKMFYEISAYKNEKDLPPFSCAFSVKGHLFLDLTSIYKLSKTVLGSDKEKVDLSICGRVLNEFPNTDEKEKPFLVKLINFIKYTKFLLNKNISLKKLNKLTKNIVFKDEKDYKKIYKQIDDLKHKINIAFYYHYITSAYSGAMNGALYGILEKEYSNKLELKSDLAGVLENIENIESVDILKSLTKIGKAIKSNSNIEEINKLKNDFFERHGHRTISEAELMNKSWKDDPVSFENVLKPILNSDLSKEKNITNNNWIKNKEIIYSKVKGKKGIINYFVKEARKGVEIRESSKSMLIKIIDMFKKEYVKLSKELVKNKLLNSEDDIYFLTHSEIGVLVNENKKSLIKKAIARKRLFEEQKKLKFNDIYLGIPIPIEKNVQYGSIKKFKGIPVSNGVSFGKARVVLSLDDALKLEKGEIMVACFTDIGWSPYYSVISGLITEKGSALSHGAVVAREYSLPLVANILNATLLIKTGDKLKIDGSSGVVEIITD